MKVLITGITGMVGSHLADYCLTLPGVEVYGLSRWRSPMENIKDIRWKIKLFNADLRDLNSLVLLLGEVKPDRIFHLAAQSYVSTSWTAPADTFSTNVIGTVNLLDACRLVKIDPLIHMCSSSEVYGQVLPEETPTKETAEFRPASPYAVSKVCEDMLGLQYFLSYGMKIIRTRMFNHTGPRRGNVFVESAFAKQIAEIEAGQRQNPLLTGNLDSTRTYLDVRDAVKAYWMLLDKCKPGAVYNIGGNTIITMADLLDVLISFAKVPIEHAVDPALLRPSDVTLQNPDVSKFRAATGWEPEIPFETTMLDLLNYQRARV